jgi:26S proteasome regulatory subunit N11
MFSFKFNLYRYTPVFQTKMLEMLKQTGREEMVVGWYHSHPGFGCWLSGVDINTQQAFEALNPRLVSIVIDPVQSVKGKVVIDAFRLINPQTIMLGQEPRWGAVQPLTLWRSTISPACVGE